MRVGLAVRYHPVRSSTRGAVGAWGLPRSVRWTLADQPRVFGANHLQTLTTRGNLAHWHGQAGDPAGTADSCKDVLADQLRVLGPDYSDIRTTCGNVAKSRASTDGDPA